LYTAEVSDEDISLIARDDIQLSMAERACWLAASDAAIELLGARQLPFNSPAAMSLARADSMPAIYNGK
jgi:hypothetical protein